jgi:sugar phosphate isomerase/epimerase
MTKPINRREALRAIATVSSAVMLGGAGALAGRHEAPRTSVGVVTYAFGIHQKNHWDGRHPGLSPALALLEECRRLGAGGIMVDLGTQDRPHLDELRHRAEQYEMYIEASIAPPKSTQDVGRFEEEIQNAQQAGATLARCVIIPGRRYEQFKSLAEFRDYERRGLRSLELAAPVLARQKFRLAVENHKDQRVDEKLATLKKVGSEFIGLCVDMGNSFTLLEDPLETVRAFAPHALTVHIKDQAVRESRTGFLFADMALGEGMLDLAPMVEVLRANNPRIRFGLEVITRDALDVPILTDQYWAAMPGLLPQDLARTLRYVRDHSNRTPFPVVSSLSSRKQMEFERRTVERSLRYARERLGFC